MKITIGQYSLLIFFRKNTYSSRLDKDRQRKHQQKRRRIGMCSVCTKMVKKKNKRTKKPYKKCEEHRKLENQRAKQKRIQNS